MPTAMSLGKIKSIGNHSKGVVSSADFEVTVNGCRTIARRHQRLDEIMVQADAFYKKGSLIAVGRTTTSSGVFGSRYALTTDRPGAQTPVLELKKSYVGKRDPLGDTRGQRLEVLHSDANSVSLGSFSSARRGEYKERTLKEAMVYLAIAGMDSRKTCLLIGKKEHNSMYELIHPTPIGRIVTGMASLRVLKTTDTFEIRPVAETTGESGAVFEKTTDLDRRIDSDGTIVHSALVVDLFDQTPLSGELFLQASRNNVIRVSEASGAFVSFKSSGGLRVQESNNADRNRGSITIRNTGTRKGDIFMFRKNRIKSASHTLIGEVKSGTPLLDLAQPGDLITVAVNQPYVKTIGMTQKEASRYLDSLGLSQVRSGATPDSSLVAVQTPPTAIEALNQGKVETFGVDKESLVLINLREDEAPESVRYFRIATGLAVGPIGLLTVEYGYSSLVGASLLKSDKPLDQISIGPENVPSHTVEEGILGVTNSVKSRMGSIGIRVDPSEEFGPTCETFQGTNIVGRVEGGCMQTIRKAGVGQVLFFAESKPRKEL